jgi:hypothetical protein
MLNHWQNRQKRLMQIDTSSAFERSRCPRGQLSVIEGGNIISVLFLAHVYIVFEPTFNRRVLTWQSGHRVRLQNIRSRFRIPPGCKVFWALYTLQCCCQNLMCVYLRKINLKKERRKKEKNLNKRSLVINGDPCWVSSTPMNDKTAEFNSKRGDSASKRS